MVDLSDYRLEVARTVGLDAERADVGTDRKFDVLLECSGSSSALVPALRRLRTNGRAALVGLGKSPVEIPFAHLNPQELTISLVNRYAHTRPTAIALAASGRVDLDAIVTHRFPLARTQDALTLARREPNSMKAVIYPNK